MVGRGTRVSTVDHQPDTREEQAGSGWESDNAHVRYRFRKWWGAKHKTHKFGPCWYWSPWLTRTFGVLQLRWDPSRLPHAKA